MTHMIGMVVRQQQSLDMAHAYAMQFQLLLDALGTYPRIDDDTARTRTQITAVAARTAAERYIGQSIFRLLRIGFYPHFTVGRFRRSG